MTPTTDDTLTTHQHRPCKISFSHILSQQSADRPPLFHEFDSAPAVTITTAECKRYDGAINATLEIVYAAPAFDHIDAEDIAHELGSGLYATITQDGDVIHATNPTYDPYADSGRRNAPVQCGDVIPHDGVAIEFVDYPTGGPLFCLPDGRTAQHDDFSMLQNSDTTNNSG